MNVASTTSHILHDSQQLTAHLPATETHATLYKSMLSGAVAGMVTDSLLLPFDTVNLRIKVQMVPPPKYTGITHAWKTILREEGVAGFFGGLGTTLKMAPINTAIYYTAYEFAKTTIASMVPKEHEPVAFFAAGAFSELCSSVSNVPTEVMKARMQLGRNPHNASGGWTKETTNYRGMVDAMTSIVRAEADEGASILWKGSACRMMSVIPGTGISFGVYETVKAMLIEDGDDF
ncbi:hypothetical protein B5M09_001661 [Aphanomyces astaci]|uniref:Mitochondrial carrier protein n=1 Tax=Aphanomyces astaci TaxID=112090 RepID=A0A425D4X1_APHAT|nr:hypothetical protein B5M09_001661 [Aphanomyces astaci]